MNEDKRRTDEPARKRQGSADENSKGQYGGLKGLGPGGGRDIEEATKTEDIDPASMERSRKRP